MEYYYRNAILICNGHDVNQIIEADFRANGFKFDRFIKPPHEFFQMCGEPSDCSTDEIVSGWHYRYWGCKIHSEGEIVHEVQEDGTSYLMISFAADGVPTPILDHILAKYPESNLILKSDSEWYPPTYFQSSILQDVPVVLSQSYVEYPYPEWAGFEKIRSNGIKCAVDFINRIQEKQKKFLYLAFEKYSK